MPSQRKTRNKTSQESQPSSSQSSLEESSQEGYKPSQRQSSSNLSKDTLERLTNDCVQYFLVADLKKVPVKRQDILKHVLKSYSKAYKTVLQRTTIQLSTVFGFQLIELSKPGTYILVNRLKATTELNNASSDEQCAKQGLLSLILCVIFMNGNIMKEEILWKFLKKYRLTSETNHKLLGDIRKLLTQEFVQQMYLVYSLIPESDPPTHEFQWGERALLEVSKMDMLDFYCKVNNMTQKTWVGQFQDASEQELPDLE